MKNYKQLKTQLYESENADGGALGGYPAEKSSRSASDDFGIHRTDNKEQVQRLQAFLHAFTSREYLDPRAALSLMRVKLNLADLDFDFNNKTAVPVGTPQYLVLKRFGGTFGTSPTHDLSKGFQVTDGIEDSLNGDHLALRLTVTEAPSGLYKMDAKIVQYSNNPEEGDIARAEEIE